MDCAASVIAVSGRVIDPAVSQATRVPIRRATSAASVTASWARCTMVIDLLQVGRHPDHAGATGDRHVDQVSPDGFASALGDAGGIRQGRAHLGAGARDSRAAARGASRSRFRPVTVPSGAISVIR